jgi:hypothetical protein
MIMEAEVGMLVVETEVGMLVVETIVAVSRLGFV